MQITPRQQILQYAHLLQTCLFERIEEQLGELSEKARALIAVVTMVQPSRHLGPQRGWRGRPAKDRDALLKAFLARAIYGCQSTREIRERLKSDATLRQLCGWREARQVPHESTFSRAFADFAKSQLPQRLQEALVQQTQKNRLIGHIARDSTAIEVRERYPDNPPPKAQRSKQKRGPKAKRSTPRAPRSRIEEQRQETLETMLPLLARHCSLGVKKSSKGHQQYWRGYKLHLDVADGQIPISAILTGACVHDSQVAIPLMTLSTQRVTYLYDLMDAGYDAAAIRAQSEALGHRPIIDPVQRYRRVERKVPLRKNSRSWTKVYDREPLPCELTPAEKLRFRERTMVERVFARLKDEFGARTIRVRGAEKVMAQLMFGVVALTVDQLLRLTG
jgi:transposase